ATTRANCASPTAGLCSDTSSVLAPATSQRAEWSTAMNEALRRKAAIVGIGATEFSANSGRSEQRLAAEAVLAALEDAGLTPDDVDGIVNSDFDATNQIDVINTVGLRNIGA